MGMIRTENPRNPVRLWDLARKKVECDLTSVGMFSNIRSYLDDKIFLIKNQKYP